MTEQEYSKTHNLTSIKIALTVLRDVHEFALTKKSCESIKEILGNLQDVTDDVQKEIKLEES